ncbi:ATP-dependent Clp protease proteolytic subunit [Terrisporobacter petrolearius]|uniref:head maturation protease, ClpP-related n=1 Tax=Terrisporobacter petrolearius TaxID=1460447 RepID=UPI003366AB9A
MYEIDIKGDIIEEDLQWLYDWVGWSYTSAKNVVNSLKEANGQPVRIKVNSPGGSVFAASEIYTELKSYSGEVNIEIVGLAASAASVISMAGKNKMSPTAQLMVHNVLGGARGDYRDMDHMSEILKNANNTIANAYMSKSGMSREKALDLMEKESWLTAQQAKEYGLIDEIMFEENNKFILNNNKEIKLYNSFSSIPDEILEKLNIKNIDQPTNLNKVDFFMQEKAQAQLNLLKLGGKSYE